MEVGKGRRYGKVLGGERWIEGKGRRAHHEVWGGQLSRSFGVPQFVESLLVHTIDGYTGMNWVRAHATCGTTGYFYLFVGS